MTEELRKELEKYITKLEKLRQKENIEMEKKQANGQPFTEMFTILMTSNFIVYLY